MYVNDHHDFMLPNRSLITNGAWRSTPDSWIGLSSAPHDTDFQPIEQDLLFKDDYHRSLATCRYPGDRSHVRTTGGQDLGLPCTRSYSMSGCWGGRTNEVQNTLVPLGAAPNPAQLFVFLDEHEDMRRRRNRQKGDERESSHGDCEVDSHPRFLFHKISQPGPVTPGVVRRIRRLALPARFQTQMGSG